MGSVCETVGGCGLGAVMNEMDVWKIEWSL